MITNSPLEDEGAEVQMLDRLCEEGPTPINVFEQIDIDSDQSLSREKIPSYWRPWPMLGKSRGRRLRRG